MEYSLTYAESATLQALIDSYADTGWKLHTITASMIDHGIVTTWLLVFERGKI